MVGFLELFAVSETAALFVFLLFCVGLGRKPSFGDVLKVAGAGLYVAVLLQLTGAAGSGWVFVSGILLPLAGVFLYGMMEALEI